MDINYEKPLFMDDDHKNYEDDKYEQYQNINNKYSLFFVEFIFYGIILFSFGYNIYKICSPKISNCKRNFKIYSLKSFKLKNDLLDDCSICLNNLLKDQKVIKLNCNHIYHKDCILNWFNKDSENGCPLCRNNI